MKSNSPRRIKAYGIWVESEDRLGIIPAGDAPYAIFASKQNAQANNRCGRIDKDYKVIPIEILLPPKKSKKKPRSSK